MTKPSVVFAHGLWADGSCFSKLIPTLQTEGHDVMASQHGLDSLATDVAAVEAFRRSATRGSSVSSRQESLARAGGSCSGPTAHIRLHTRSFDVAERNSGREIGYR